MATIAMDPPDVEAPLRCARSRSNMSESQTGFPKNFFGFGWFGDAKKEGEMSDSGQPQLATR